MIIQFSVLNNQEYRYSINELLFSCKWTFHTKNWKRLFWYISTKMKHIYIHGKITSCDWHKRVLKIEDFWQNQSYIRKYSTIQYHMCIAENGCNPKIFVMAWYTPTSTEQGQYQIEKGKLQLNKLSEISSMKRQLENICYSRKLSSPQDTE